MNLSRRAKLDRETDARGGKRKAPAAVAPPDPAAVILPVPVPETAPAPESDPPPPAPAVATERPKMPRFVRPAAEKRATASAAPLSPPTTKASGKVMSRNVTVTPKGAASGAKGPQPARGPIANTKKGTSGRRK